jgi:class 3 adenylate cyclase
MGIQDDVRTAVDQICSVAWNERSGTVVPETEEVVFKNGAVNVEATYLYADLANSTGLAHHVSRKVAARVIRSYLNASARVIRTWNGAIRSYDGDRVMGIFIGGSQRNNAARAALGINWAFCEVLKPTISAKWPTVPSRWTPDHAVGVDHGEAMIVRGGVVGENDLISIGKAPNVAAKLSDIRGSKYLYITDRVHSVLKPPAKTATSGNPFWSRYTDQEIGGETVKVYASTGWKTP